MPSTTIAHLAPSSLILKRGLGLLQRVRGAVVPAAREVELDAPPQLRGGVDAVDPAFELAPI
jgi:hypothetical protein